MMTAVRTILTAGGAADRVRRMRAIPSCAVRQPGRDGDPFDGRISLPRTETCIAHHRLHTKAHNQMPAQKLALPDLVRRQSESPNTAIARSLAGSWPRPPGRPAAV